VFEEIKSERGRKKRGNNNDVLEVRNEEAH